MMDALLWGLAHEHPYKGPNPLLAFRLTGSPVAAKDEPVALSLSPCMEKRFFCIFFLKYGVVLNMRVCFSGALEL